jgi:hypothetical protein
MDRPMSRRRLLTSLFGLVLIAMLVVIGYVALAAPPLAFANSASVIGAIPHDEDGIPQYDVAFADRGEVRWGVEVRNTLPVPVRIEGLAQSELSGRALIDKPELHLLRDVRVIGVEAEAVRPFEPVTLGPGDAVFLAITDHFVDCATAHAGWALGSGLVRSDVGVAVSVLGVPRMAKVALPFALAYQAPADDCADAAPASAGVPRCGEPTRAGEPPADKPLPAELHARPIGPVGSGFAVAFESSRLDGGRRWWCIVQHDGQWTGFEMDQDVFGFDATADGHVVAARLIGDESDRGDDVVLVVAPGAAPTVVPLAAVGDAEWLDDWSFWGSLQPIPGGGFLLAGGTRLAVLSDDGTLAFRELPAGLTPLSATSDPHTWLVARAHARQEGGVAPPFMLWHEGDAQPSDIPGQWFGWVPSTTPDGLVWLHGGKGWSLLHPNGTIVQVAATPTPAYDTDIAPDGSMILVASDGCGQGDAATCRVHVIRLADGAEVATLPGQGISVWNEAGGLFVTQGALAHPLLFRLSADGARELPLPGASGP